MMKIILTLIAMVFSTNVAMAQNFYNNKSRDWTVTGIPQKGQLHPVCSANYFWNDGSEFMFIVDLVDGELYMLFINNQWSIGDETNKLYNFRINVYSDGQIRGFNGEYELISKNTIRVRSLKGEMLVLFAEADEFRFVMPGSITNARVVLNGTRGAVEMLKECVKSYK